MHSQPRHAIGAEPYPLGEFAGRFKACDVLRCVRDATDCPQLLLGHELVAELSHRITPLQGSIAMPQVEKPYP